MPIYDFSYDFSETPAAGQPETPARYPPGLQQTADLDIDQASGSSRIGNTNITEIPPYQSSSPEDVRDFIEPGFKALDTGIKQYFSSIRVPTKDSYRLLQIKVSGFDKSLSWREELENGRAILPIASINRTSWKFHKEKFSPPYLPMTMHYTSQRGNLMVLTYRPVPFLVEYSLQILTESKRDIEYAMFQVCTRFNPLAEFVIFDNHIRGTVVLHLLDTTDASEKEVAFDKYRLQKYEFKMQAEAWLPLPTRVVPSVIGTIISAKDQNGSVIEYITKN